jgi:hypothetical protein
MAEKRSQQAPSPNPAEVKKPKVELPSEEESFNFRVCFSGEEGVYRSICI